MLVPVTKFSKQFFQTMHKLGTRFIGLSLLAILTSYALLAYVVVPALWQHYEHQPGLANLPMVTTTKFKVAGDPMNVALVGSREELIAVMTAAGWVEPDRTTVLSSAKMARSVALRRSYVRAPVSSLFYQGHRQDLAFEKQHGKDARQRHHIRLWKVLEAGAEGRPVWLGAATFDQGVGFSHFTGQVTHHISADVDAERNFLIHDLKATLRLSLLYEVSGTGPIFWARNGGGDVYHSDGEVEVAVIAPAAAVQTLPAQVLPAPALTSFKDEVWARVTGTQINNP